MKQLGTLIALSAALLLSAAKITVPVDKIAAMPHPRLLIPTVGIEKLRSNAKTEVGKAIADYTLRHADWLLTQPPTPYEVKYGNRTLYYTRAVQSNCIALGMAYLLTGERKYADRCVREVMAAVELPTWFRRFYLDTAEITFGVAIGYDWCYDAFTPEQREKIARAIMEKGVKLSYSKNRSQIWWIKASMNQNQVIHTCLAAAMIAIAEHDRKLAEDVVVRAIENLPRSMRASYYPNGAYPEGPGYWSYGTTFNCILLSLLEGVCGTCYELDKQPGFDKTGDFFIAVCGNVGPQFSYSDTGLMPMTDFAKFYLGHRFKRPDYIPDFILNLIRQFPQRDVKKYSYRDIPFALLYADEFSFNPDRSKSPLTYYSGDRAKIPVIMMRNSFDRNSAYVGIKGGVPDGGHGHMDVGSFVFETDGERWVADLGTFNYGNMEKIKKEYGAENDDNFRWRYLHLGPRGHSVLQINDALQKFKAASRTEKFDAQSKTVVFDLSAIYADHARSVKRQWQLMPDNSLIVTDTLTGLTPGAEVDFHFPTPGAVEKTAGKLLLLRIGNKRLAVTSESDAEGAWQAAPWRELGLKGEPPRPGINVCKIVYKAPQNGKLTIKTVFKPAEHLI